MVRPNGDLVNGFNLIYNFKNAHKIRGYNVAILRSFDKGATWESQAKIVDKLRTATASSPDNGAPVRTGDIIPEIAAGPEGNLYLVWQDARFNGFDEIAFSMSSDGGSNWSSTIKINKTPGGIGTNGQAFTPSVQVGADGTVAVTYYDFRNKDGGSDLKTDYFLAHCHGGCDNANNWEETRITPNSFDMSQAPVARGFFTRDYELGTAGSDFFAFFSQPHGSDPASIFFGKVGP